MKFYEARDERASDAIREAQARYAALARRLAARLARLRRADPQAATAATCPPTVSGRLAVIDKPILDWWVDDGGYQTQPALPVVLRSPVFQSIADHAAYVELGSARYIAAVHSVVTPVTSTGSMTFEGGTVDATLAIGDIEAGQFVCACHVTSQPLTILSIEQGRPKTIARRIERLPNEQWSKHSGPSQGSNSRPSRRARP